jgi:hypothetical protein
MPVALQYLVSVFFRLRERRPREHPVTWGDIVGFTTLACFRLFPWEVGVIEKLDQAFMAAVTAREKEEAAAKATPGKSNFKSVSQWKT